MAQRTVNHAVLTLALLTSVAAQMGVMMPSMGYMGFGGSMFGPGMSGGNQAGTTYKGGVNTENPNAVFSPPAPALLTGYSRSFDAVTGETVAGLKVVIGTGLNNEYDMQGGMYGGMYSGGLMGAMGGMYGKGGMYGMMGKGGMYGGMGGMYGGKGGMYGGMGGMYGGKGGMYGGMGGMYGKGGMYGMYGKGGMYGGMGGMYGGMGGMYGKGGMYGGKGGMYGGKGGMYGDMSGGQLEATIEVKLPDTAMPVEVLLVFTDPAPTSPSDDCPLGPVLLGPASEQGGQGYGHNSMAMGGYGGMMGMGMGMGMGMEEPDFGVVATLTVQPGSNTFTLKGLGAFTDISQLAGRGAVLCEDVGINASGQRVCQGMEFTALDCVRLAYALTEQALDQIIPVS